ncbi:vWA domain-containing protein [Novipirellula artificiosorum]|nr:vWA domain-containing protein [Novipirellula artificiosorum]
MSLHRIHSHQECAESLKRPNNRSMDSPPARPRDPRHGSVLALMAFLLPVLALLAAFCINTAQMQLTQTELMVATDAAARAGGRAFSEHQTTDAAEVAAIATAALNDVDGEPLQIRSGEAAGEIEFGITTQPGGLTGRYLFQRMPIASITSGENIASAVRVNGRRDDSSLSGRVPLIIPGLFDTNDFASHQQSVAMQVDRDISLILDRSGSMVPELDFDWPSGKSPWYTSTKNAGVAAGMLTSSYSYYSGTSYYYAPGVNSMTYQQWVWNEHYGLEDCPSQPWQDLVEAVDAFLNVLDTTVQEEQVSVASYSEWATTDIGLTKDFSVVRSTIRSLNPGGWTAIGRGMEKGMPTLLSSDARPYAAKTMVVMTDGVENRGPDSLPTAQGFVQNCPLTIHTVTFGDGADQNAMRAVALAGGGKHYHAANGEQLKQIFEEIANNLPTILTE